MARRHGCQLPADCLQVLAISVFLMLSIAFYAFFVPFLGNQSHEHVAITLYSIIIFSVIILYIRCALIDPADSGILITGDGVSAYNSQSGVGYGEPYQNGLNPELKTSEKKITTCSQIICCFYGLMVKEDCRNNVDTTQQLIYDEGLYCTLCNAEVGKLSKHCSSCDKCVDGFDHHCRWLNNCIGRKNYVTFLLLITTTLAWVAVECGVGIAVLVRCFVNKTAVQNEVIDRLGDVFSRMLVIIVVTVCTTLAFISMVPLGELFFFHMILIKKGITTYDFVVAMRTQNGSPMHGEHHCLPSSPECSTPTAVSDTSIIVPHIGAWCTPPRIITNKPEEIMAQLDQICIPSNIDRDAPRAVESAKRVSKQPIRISTWKLAKLNSNEAMKAGARARASSSVLRPISSHTSSPNSHRGTPTLLPSKESYLPTPGTLSSSLVMKVQQHSSIKHFNNPIFQSSMSRSPYSIRTNDGEETTSKASSVHEALRSGDASGASKANTSSSVYWDQEAGRFVLSQNFVESSSSRIGSHSELVYIGNSIFSGGPLSNKRTPNSRNGRGLPSCPCLFPVS